MTLVANPGTEAPTHGQTRWSMLPTHDEAAVRAHLRALHAAGMKLAVISLRGGVNRKAIQWLVSAPAAAATPPAYRIRRVSALRILALPIPRKAPIDPEADPMVPALGTQRRLQALVAAGFPWSYLARRAGLPIDAMTDLLADPDHVTESVADRVIAVFDELEMTVGPSDYARDEARLRGWAPPLAWDADTIDDPETGPDYGTPARYTFTERYTEWLEAGYTDLTIAAKMGVQPRSLLRQIQRYRMAPSAELVATARRGHAS